MTDLKLKGCIVSKTGPIIALMIIGKLDILEQLFNEIIITFEVHQELLQGKSVKDFPHQMRIAVYEQSEWINIQKLQSSLNPAFLSFIFFVYCCDVFCQS